MAKPKLGDSPSFAQEWVTVGDHRILIEDDPGPPRVVLRRVAMLAAWRLESISNYDPVRLVKITGGDDRFSILMAVSKNHKDVAQIACIDVQEALEGFYTSSAFETECIVSPSSMEVDDRGYTAELVRFGLEG